MRKIDTQGSSNRSPDSRRNNDGLLEFFNICINISETHSSVGSWSVKEEGK